MDRVGKLLPPDAEPIGGGGRGRRALYAEQLAKAVEHHRNHPKDQSWWLISSHTSKHAANAALGRLRRGQVELPDGTEWEFQTRTEATTERGLLYGRLISVEQGE